MLSLQAVAESRHRDFGHVVLAVHLAHFRSEQQIGAEGGKPGRVRRLVAGIGLQILVRPELGGVDEQAHAGASRPGQGQAHQRQVPFVQGAHGGHKAHRFPGRPPGADTGAQIGDGAHGVDGSVVGRGHGRLGFSHGGLFPAS